MKRIALLLTLLAAASSARAAEKQLWATSFLGRPAPEFVVEKWLTPEPDRKGKFVLLDFWATWCGPCRKAIPELNAFHKKFSDKLVVTGVSDETEDKVRALKEPKLEYASAVDTQGRMKKALGVKGIPHVILVDPAGIVRWEGFPLLEGYELTEAVVQAVLDAEAASPKLCAHNREVIAGAKRQWALEKSQPATALPTERELKVYLLRDQLPVCPAGGTYTLNAVEKPVSC